MRRHLVYGKLEQWKRDGLCRTCQSEDDGACWSDAAREKRAHVIVLLSPAYARQRVIVALRFRHVSRRSFMPLHCSASHRHSCEPHLALALVPLSGPVASLLACTTTSTTSMTCPSALLLFSRRMLGSLRTTTHIITFCGDS